MSRSSPLRTAALLLAAALTPLGAQTVSGDLQLWFTKMTDGAVRAQAAASYYNWRPEFREDGFSLRRAELKVSGKVLDDLECEVMVDPSISTSATNPTILQDAVVKWVPTPWLEIRAGQFKTLQTWEGNVSSTELPFAERSQLGRMFGDKRDRGAVAALVLGDPKGFGAKVSLGVFNGMSDAVSGKASDANAQKDLVLRLDFNVARTHRFGLYTLQGSTDAADKSGVSAAANPGNGWPSQAAIYAERDRTTNLGAFYVLQTPAWTVSAEAITGLLGRRFPTFGASVRREHLDQRFLGWVATLARTVGPHTFLLRHDVMDCNAGHDWYTASNPYRTPAADMTPRFTETTAGWTYAFLPDKVKAANLKLNVIHRSRNVLKPQAPQTALQGGDTLVAAFQVAF